MISTEPANSIDRAREFVLFSVDQGELNLVGTWSYTNGAVGNETPSRVVIEGTTAADGSFWPNVRLKVRKGRAGKWKRIATSSNPGDRATVTIEPNVMNFDLTVNLDAFKPLLDKYKFGRIVLNTGRTSEFELKDLSPPEQERESKDESAERRQGISASDSESLAQTNPEKARSQQDSNASILVANRTVALVSNPTQSRLGSRIDDFRSLWGPPSDEENLTRTATLKWKRLPANGESIAPAVFDIQVAFLDGIALRNRVAIKAANNISQASQACEAVFNGIS